MAVERIAGPRVAAGPLEAFARQLLRAGGADEPSATHTARAVVDASSRAFDTHGIRLLPFYLDTLAGGRVTGAPTLTVTEKAASVVHVDAGDGFGHYPSFRAVDLACDRAATTGVAVATVGRSSHHGATGVYTRAAALRGFAAIGMTHSDACVIPHGGRAAFFGTNPISFSLPVAGEDPLLLDMATSAIPLNRVGLRRATGTPLPPEVAIDGDGRITTDPFAATALVPLGGAAFGYKGAGLATMVDLLCSAFTGMGHGNTLACFNGPDFASPIPIGHVFIVMAPAVFQALSLFDARVSAFLADLRGQAPVGADPIRAPGDLEKAEAARRRDSGIPVDPTTWAALEAAAARFGVARPAPVPDIADG